MLSQKPSLSVYYVALITALLVVTFSIQSSTSVLIRQNCVDFDTYSEIIPGFKALDALKAQRNYILSPGIKSQFQPSMTKYDTIDRNTVMDAIKSLIDLIILKESYENLTEGIQNPQLSLVQVLFTKVVEDTCHWLNQSDDINIENCTNIDVSQMQALQSRIVLHDTLKSTFEIVNKVMGYVDSKHSHYCGWINDRILGKCADPNNVNYGHRQDLNERLCKKIRGCDDTELCILQPMQ